MYLQSISTNQGQVSIIKLAGRFDAGKALTVKQWFSDEAPRLPSAKVVVNLTEVSFIDSSGLATLIQGLKHCRRMGGDIYLCGLRHPVGIIFSLTKLDKVFKIFSHEQEAVQVFAQEENRVQVLA